jgi:hypothetical protein
MSVTSEQLENWAMVCESISDAYGELQTLRDIAAYLRANIPIPVSERPLDDANLLRELANDAQPIDFGEGIPKSLPVSVVTEETGARLRSIADRLEQQTNRYVITGPIRGTTEQPQ